MTTVTSPYRSHDQLPLSRKQLGLAVDSIILAQKRGLRRLPGMMSDSIGGKVPVFEDEITREHARKARVLQLLKKCRSMLKKPALPKISEDDDCSEPDLDKADSVVIIQLCTPDSRANFAPPAQSALAPAAAEAMVAAEADTAASHPSAVRLTTVSPLATATSAIAEDTEATTSSSSSSSAQVAEELTNAPAATTTTTTTTTATTSSSSSAKKVSKGKELLKSASRRIKAAAASIVRGFAVGSHGLANSSATLALCPVAMPANTYTGPYSSYYNPHDGPCSSYALGYHH